ncbi:DUF4838 domain-containing protein [Paenibacillus sp. strain BS8-2]
MNRKLRIVMSLLVVYCILVTIMFPNSAVVRGETANDAETSELFDHWAYPVMNKWLMEGLLNGKGKDQYLPDKPITRAEFVTFVNRVFKFTQKSEHPFKDVAASDWYADDIAKIYRAGIIQGVSKSKFEPNKNISREDAAVIISRAFKLMSSGHKTDSFKDEESISSYALEAVRAMYDKGYAKGRGNGEFSPKSNISRAEVIQLLDNVMGTLIQKEGSYSSDASGNLVINTEGVILENIVIYGDLFITQGAGQGNIKLDGVIVHGNTYVWGGGEISIRNSTIQGTLIVDKWDSNIRVVTSGYSQIAATKLISGGTIEEERKETTPTPETPTPTPTSETPTSTPTSTPTPTPDPDELVIVKDGSPVAAVVISGDADMQTKSAADELIEYVKKSTGAQLKLLVDNSKSNKIAAENGTIQVTYYEELPSAPIVMDYRISMIINGMAESASIRPSSVEWDTESKTATLYLPPLAVAGVQQSVVYKITYKNTTPLYSETMTIEADPSAPLNLNPSFETQYGVTEALPWRFWVDGSGKSIKMRSNEQARSGSYSFKASGVPAAWPNQEVSLTHYGDYEYTAYFLTPESLTTNGTIRVFIELVDADGQLIDTKWGDVVNAKTSQGVWTELKWEGEISQQVNGKQVSIARLGLTLENFVGKEHVFIDDAQLIMKNQPIDTTNSGNLLLESDDQTLKERDQSTASVESELEAAQTLIYVGKFGLSVQEQLTLLQDLDSDGFVIHQNGKKITIAGPTSWGTEFGVSEFLERYVGVLWLMPGEDWEDVPESNQLSVPIGDEVSEEPAFFSRTFEVSPWSTEEQWKRNNKIHWHIDFGHNLYNLFPPAVYKDTNPEFYAAGADLSKDHTWQPCFTAEGIVEEAIANINTYFDQHPQAESYSIGINDTTSFCEANPAHPDYPNKLNSIGMVDTSNIFFEWVNQVAAGVFAKHPDKYLGTYAYYNVYDPPTDMQIDPRVVVYITDDRLSWKDPDLKAEGHAVTEGWAQTGATVAFYEYLYGMPYMVPRVYTNLMQESYIYAAEQGVGAFYGELNPNVGEGPKGWLSMKLQWDPYQDKDALLEEWYERAVGEDAAADLQAYFEIWEQFWEGQLEDLGWYKGWKNNFPRTNFMPLFSASYLSDVSAADMNASRVLLESVVAKAVTPKQKKRAEDMLTMFRYYELSYHSYPNLTEVFEEPTTEEEAMALLQIAIDRLEFDSERLAHIKRYENDEYLRVPFSINWEIVSNNHNWLLVNWISNQPNGSTAQYIDSMANTAEQENVRHFLGKLIAATGSFDIRNPGFEEGFEHWHDWPDTIAELTDDAHTGTKALRVKVSSREQTIYLEGGKTYTLSFHGKLDGNMSVKNLVGINFWNVPNVGLAGDWATINTDTYEQYSVTFTVPHYFSHATIVVYREPGEGAIYVDDFSLIEGELSGVPTVASVMAMNGQLEVKLDGIVPNPPVVSDFAIIPVVNGQDAMSEAPAAVAWDAASRTATLTVTSLAETSGDQQLAYKVKYLGGSEVLSNVVTIGGVSGAPVNRNASFEIGYDGPYSALPWEFYVAAGKISRVAEEAKSGSYSLKVIAHPETYAVQSITLPEKGDYKVTFDFKTSAVLSGSETISLHAYYTDEANERFDVVFGPSVFATESNGEWTTLTWDISVPETSNGKEVKGLYIGIGFSNFNGEVLYVDDFELKKR